MSAQVGAEPRNARSASRGWSSLTEKQRQVAVLAAAGLANPEIGERLFISRSTVKLHLACVYQKLGVRGRIELAREASADGIKCLPR